MQNATPMKLTVGHAGSDTGQYGSWAVVNAECRLILSMRLGGELWVIVYDGRFSHG